MVHDDSRPGPDFSLEARWLRQLGSDAASIAGVDEAGCAPWAGPVVAAAVALEAHAIPAGIDDSKALTPDARERLYALITSSAVAWGVGIASVGRIDRDNILQARLWAMRQALSRLERSPDVALIDGNRAPPRLACRFETVVGGDARSLSIAAASIIAKVTRDRIMERLGHRHPGYGWERNRGYGTPEHRRALARLGVTRHHRRSFRPVQLALAAGPPRGCPNG